MVSGYVLINTKNSYEHEVADKLSRIDELIDVEPLAIEETAMADPFFEDYSIIAKFKVNDSKNLKEIIDEKIHNIDGVEKTKFVTKSKI